MANPYAPQTSMVANLAALPASTGSSCYLRRFSFFLSNFLPRFRSLPPKQSQLTYTYKNDAPARLIAERNSNGVYVAKPADMTGAGANNPTVEAQGITPANPYATGTAGTAIASSGDGAGNGKLEYNGQLAQTFTGPKGCCAILVRFRGSLLLLDYDAFLSGKSFLRSARQHVQFW